MFSSIFCESALKQNFNMVEIVNRPVSDFRIQFFMGFTFAYYLFVTLQKSVETLNVYVSLSSKDVTMDSGYNEK